MNKLVRSFLTTSKLHYKIRTLQTSQKREKLPIILFTLIKPIARITSYVLGRNVRGAWKKLPQEQQRTYIEIMKANRGKFLLSGFFSGTGLYYLYESHIQYCPITGRRKFVALTPDQARKIGEANFTQILEEVEGIIVPESDPVYLKISKVANAILHANRDLRQIYDKTWTLTVIDAPVVNAFVLPSGNIFVYTGLLKACDTYDEVGVVLSHEIAHVVLGHVEEKLTRTSFLQMVLLVPMSLLWVLIPHDGIGFITTWFFNSVADIMLELPFSRFMEIEADDVGLVLAAKACLDVRKAPEFWSKMSLNRDDALQSEDFEFFSTHPADKTRQENLENKIENAIKIRNDCGCEKLSRKANEYTNKSS